MSLIDYGADCDYAELLAKMQSFTRSRQPDTEDEFWVLSHRPVFTQGLNGQPQHVLDPGDIPVVRTDRGGQVTYHGPGQLVVYTLVDLKRAGVGVRAWVTALEQVVIDYLTEFAVQAERLQGAPGVYVDGAKIAALGLKVRQGRCYHGLSLNLDVDLAPFARINPCGMANLPVTDLRRCADIKRNQMPDYRQAGSAIVLGLQKILLEQSPMA
ncbi:MAG: octanoyltransferase [Halothiobacillus sp. 14-56-357]|jgi:lipoyl(octanoyl) transferase|uniref:lipoyl(octanoyl) transferase LipB n=1 Tax=Halothiobacillus sp. 15-55-196 TaxID=1970382 RepID=UPI000BC5882F|nr:lipoyl(octanoyl) transferase LipB [Halothiobacillus sp. 15-55-196]OZB37376.1 MAG: octanoyltransferase [Halothiobacillus sp. 15-55-196]OZB57298.1 MAG: octanoyltransferase [Halothiobacillus sp. 14-56-357]OZB79082.1 MAG: octanoyltransferase [Halothiobacillus sp. 13-55-115]